MDKRPILNKNISVEDFRAFYWLKSELQAFCKTEGLHRTGAKLDLANCIEIYLTTGEKTVPLSVKSTKPNSSFDWKTAPLHTSTLITDNYKNTENVRAFFQTQVDKKFKFNIQFMAWMKANTGKTLADAIVAWQEIEVEKKKGKRKDIAPQFEYNTYIRDFLAANPKTSKATAIKYWKVKRSMRGDNVYRAADLDLLS